MLYMTSRNRKALFAIFAWALFFFCCYAFYVVVGAIL